ncbi:unnamed protein product [Plutella xylostella]|uniref:(diamondback moth) hypothetical protein n=1 Tax=Plutella xylostella TaxID=51655 RepID=A0A8S4FVM1_PLUXY|nr:unnamed protein product [Plutella xylostella]
MLDHVAHVRRLVALVVAEAANTYLWKELLDIGREVMETRVPLDWVAWYPGGSMTRHRWLHRSRTLLFHWLPAIIVDSILFCLGVKPVLIHVQKHIQKGMEVFEYYTNNQWDFRSDAVQRLRTKMTPREREAYKMDADGTGTAVFEYCTNNQWDSRSDAVQRLRIKMTPRERGAYKMDADGTIDHQDD